MTYICLSSFRGKGEGEKRRKKGGRGRGGKGRLLWMVLNWNAVLES
jgi:hypothetical protein